MKTFFWSSFVTGTILIVLTGCSTAPKSPDVADGIRQSLKADGFKDVSVAEDRDKGVVTLGGHVTDEGGRARAEGIAKSMAAGQVVANQIAVLPPGVEGEAKTVNSDWDQAIQKNLEAALIQAGMNNDVKCSVKNRVVTLTGDVNSQGARSEAARVAGSVPNVYQVVNEVQVKNQKASSY